MSHQVPRRGIILNVIPSDRYTMLVSGGRSPKVGDIVQLDQGYSAPNGDEVSMVYCINSDSIMIYEAHLLNSDFELLPN